MKFSMKKSIFLACSLAAMQASSNQLISTCGYKDYFHLSEMTPPGVFILGGYSEQDVFLEIISPRSFIIRDGYTCDTGYAHVTVALDSRNWCILDIKDGPYINHPLVSATCSGLRYQGMQYDGLASYSYSLSFN